MSNFPDVPFSADQIEQLKSFVDSFKADPLIIYHPKLAFFKEFLRSLGAIPNPCPKFCPTPLIDTSDSAEEPAASEESDEESVVDLDMEGVIASEPIDESQEMGDASKEPTEEERDQSDEKRSAAMRAFSEQKFDEAITFYTEAILLNPQSALLFAKRGQVYLKLNKLYSCIKDCSYALELNCDSAAAFKFRGRAYRLLGKFEEASHDLCESLKIDYDDQTNEWLQEVKPNAEKLRQHKLNAQRNQAEKLHREKLQRANKVRNANLKAAQAAAEEAEEAAAAAEKAAAAAGRAADKAEKAAGMSYDSPRFGPTDYTALLTDPDFMEAIKDPELIAAFQDVTANPANFVKYQNNPKVVNFIEKLQTKFGKHGEAFTGRFPGFGGAAAGAKPGPKCPANNDDVDLD